MKEIIVSREINSGYSYIEHIERYPIFTHPKWYDFMSFFLHPEGSCYEFKIPAPVIYITVITPPYYTAGLSPAHFFIDGEVQLVKPEYHKETIKGLCIADYGGGELMTKKTKSYPGYYHSWWEFDTEKLLKRVRQKLRELGIIERDILPCLSGISMFYSRRVKRKGGIDENNK